MDRSADHIIQRVLRHYDIGNLVKARAAETGYINQNWIIDATHGQYFVKCRHPDLRDAAVIRGQHGLIRHLRARGFPAPSVVDTIRGDSLLILDGEFYEVQQYIAHSRFVHGRWEHLVEAAKTLAAYHGAASGFTSPALASMGELYSPAGIRANLDHLVEQWQLNRHSGFSRQVAQLQEHAARLGDSFGAHGDLPQLVIHGDYYADNLLFEGDQIIGVVDYDKASWQPRVAEIAEAVIYFASPRPARMQHLVYPGTLEWAPLSGFLRAYTEESAVTEGEARALPDYIGAIWLSVSLQRLAETAAQPSHAVDALAEVVTLADWARVLARGIADVAAHVCSG